MPASNPDWAQMMTWGTYSGNGNTYFSGSDPSWRFALLAQDTARYMVGTDHPYEDTINSRMLAAQRDILVPGTPEWDAWNAPGALRDYAALNPKPSAGVKGDVDTDQTFWQSVQKKFRGKPDKVGFALTSASQAMVVLLVGVVLVAIAFWSVAQPVGTKAASLIVGKG